MSVGSQVLFPKESYELVGCAYAVFNSMGYGHHERNYQRGYTLELDEKGYHYKKELCVKVTHKGIIVGRYFLDFLVNNIIVVELKVGREFYANHIKQVLSYLKATNKRLGIIFLFTPKGIEYKRIVN